MSLVYMSLAAFHRKSALLASNPLSVSPLPVESGKTGWGIGVPVSYLSHK